MFSVIVAWVAFVWFSFTLGFNLYWGWTGKIKRVDYPKLISFVAIWFVSGVYLFG